MADQEKLAEVFEAIKAGVETGGGPATASEHLTLDVLDSVFGGC